METTRYDEREFTVSLGHYSPPVLAWAALFTVMAFTESVWHDHPKAIVEAALAVPLIAEVTTGVTVVHDAPPPAQPRR